MAGVARPGDTWLGAVRQGMAGYARRGLARRCKARRGPTQPGKATNFTKGKDTMSDTTLAGVTYRWREGTHQHRIKAEDAYHELARIRKEQGELTPQAVVDESEPEAAPLHPYFEWDNDTAANEYRLSQSRKLIRAVIVVPEPAERTIQFTAFTYVTPLPGRDEGFYEHTPVVIRTPSLRERAIAALDAKAESMERSAKELYALVVAEDANRATVAERLLTSVSDAREALAQLR